MQRREGRRACRLSFELKIVAVRNIRREKKKDNREREKKRGVEGKRREKCGKRRKQTGKERGKECNQSDSLGAIRTIHRSSSKHVRNCMLASPWEY